MPARLHVLVLGGYGAVGRHVVARLAQLGHRAVAAGRDPARADRVLDVGSMASVRDAARTMDVVVNASGVEDPSLVEAVTALGVAFVDVSASHAYGSSLLTAARSAPVLVDVGLAPGLTNLLAADVFRRGCGSVEIAVVLGAGERHGRAATEWSVQLLGRSFADPATGQRIRNYSQPRMFDLPLLGRRRLLRADFSDQHWLTHDLRTPVRTWFGLDSALATCVLGSLTWLPGARSVPPSVRLPGDDRWLALARGDCGTISWAVGRSQSAATGRIAAWAAVAAASASVGLHPIHRVLTLDQMPDDLSIRVRRPTRELSTSR